MFTKSLIFFFFFTIISNCSYAIDKIPNSYAEFVAGISLLTTVKQNLTVTKRLYQFESLGKVTGLSPEEVQTFLLTLKNNPEKGKRLYDQMNQLNATSLNDTTTR